MDLRCRSRRSSKLSPILISFHVWKNEDAFLFESQSLSFFFYLSLFLPATKLLLERKREREKKMWVLIDLINREGGRTEFLKGYTYARTYRLLPIVVGSELMEYISFFLSFFLSYYEKINTLL